MSKGLLIIFAFLVYLILNSDGKRRRDNGDGRTRINTLAIHLWRWIHLEMLLENRIINGN
jgi:hypothetical protein